MYINILQDQTWAARSTRILAKEDRLVCSNFSLGTMARPVAFHLSRS